MVNKHGSSKPAGRERLTKSEPASRRDLAKLYRQLHILRQQIRMEESSGIDRRLATPLMATVPAGEAVFRQDSAFPQRFSLTASSRKLG
jgi:hypothetical protein